MLNQLILVALLKDNWLSSKIKRFILETILKINDIELQEMIDSKISILRAKFLELFISFIPNDILEYIDKNECEDEGKDEVEQSKQEEESQLKIDEKLINNSGSGLNEDLPFDQKHKKYTDHLKFLQEKANYYHQRFINFKMKLQQFENINKNILNLNCLTKREFLENQTPQPMLKKNKYK